MEPTRLLDLTRSLRRAGRMPTGVDRVERAYLDEFLQIDVPAFGLMRTALGYVLLNRAGMTAFRDRLDDREWGAADMVLRVPRGRDLVLMQAEAYVRSRAMARCLPVLLRRMLTQQLLTGFDYYNVGHSNLTERALGRVKAAGGSVHVLIHDVIPLEFPEFQREGTVAPFRDKLKRVRRYADRVIYNSHDTRQRAEAQMQGWGALPDGIVAHLGTMPIAPRPQEIPSDVMPDRPYFVTVGTIEPRKNHAFLLDLWDQMGPDAPPLIICGSRGWRNEAVFDRLDRLNPRGPVIEVAGLSDGALAALVAGSAGSLFPSFAEGFGIPPIEALAQGARVLCNDLAVLRENTGGYGTFFPVFEPEMWLKTIKRWGVKPSSAETNAGFVRPDWENHFNTVLKLR